MMGYHSKRIGHQKYTGLAVALSAALPILRPDPKFKTLDVLDIGSSCGAMLKALQDNAAIKTDRLVGVDHSTDAQDLWLLDSRDFQLHDLEESPINFATRFDLTICTEVAEHIREEDNVRATVANNTDSGGVLWFSGARPGQKGRGHVNCQTGRYWIDKLERRGFQYSTEATNEFCHAIGAWNARHIPEQRIPSFYLNSLLFVKS